MKSRVIGFFKSSTNFIQKKAGELPAFLFLKETSGPAYHAIVSAIIRITNNPKLTGKRNHRSSPASLMTNRTKPAKIDIVPCLILADLKVRILADEFKEFPMAVKFRVSLRGRIVNKDRLIIIEKIQLGIQKAGMGEMVLNASINRRRFAQMALHDRIRSH
jgi:hypothetical protein